MTSRQANWFSDSLFIVEGLNSHSSLVFTHFSGGANVICVSKLQSIPCECLLLLEIIIIMMIPYLSLLPVGISRNPIGSLLLDANISKLSIGTIDKLLINKINS